MIVGIHQPNYLPWLGYFRKIACCDVFVFLDNVQMPSGKSFVSRNAIKSQKGRQWLTVPVTGRTDFQDISSVRIADFHWARKHLRTLEVNYSAARWKGLISDLLAPMLAKEEWMLSTLNILLIEAISLALGLSEVRFVRASTLGLSAQGAASIPEILKKLGACTYVTGMGSGTARHLSQEVLSNQGVDVKVLPDVFADYQQCHGAFQPRLSVIDALLNIGPQETRHLL